MKEGNDISNIYSKFEEHTSDNFLKTAFLKNFLRWQPPLSISVWRLILAPGKVVPPIFIHVSDRERCRIDHLNSLGDFSFGFGRQG